MSLINEALKKARLEAARKGDRRHGLLAATHVPSRRSVWPWIVTAGSLSLAIGVIVGVVLRGGDGDRIEEQASAPFSQSEPLEPVATSTQDESHAARDEVIAASSSLEEKKPVREEDAPRQLESEPREQDPIEQDTIAPSEIEEPLAIVGPESAAESAERSPPPSASSTAIADPGLPQPPDSIDGQSFIRTVPLQTGKEIVLNGIAWSDTGPVALLNGRALEKGEYVDGWKLEVIERREVELTKGDATIRVRLK